MSNYSFQLHHYGAMRQLIDLIVLNSHFTDKACMQSSITCMHNSSDNRFILIMSTIELFAERKRLQPFGILGVMGL